MTSPKSLMEGEKIEVKRIKKIIIMLEEFNLDYNLQYQSEVPNLELVIKIIAKEYPKSKEVNLK